MNQSQHKPLAQDLGRDQWKTSLGFMLAAMGSAIGLGNIWKFPYITGLYGGSAFIIVYLVCIALIGLPIMLSEFSIGRKTQKDAVGAFEELAPGRPWFMTGLFGVIAAFVTLSFYAVVAGWAMSYTFKAISGELLGTQADKLGDLFGDHISTAMVPILWQLAFMFFTILIVSKGISGGIEKWNKILMPTLGVLIVILAIRSVTLPNSAEGIEFLFVPDFSKLTTEAVLVALGHAFFSLSLGMGAMITYGSYVPKNQNLPKAAVGISFSDTIFALVAGLAVFPAVFAFGMDPGKGPGLVFVTLPAIFQQMPLGQLFAILFFALLSIAALTSAISLLEVAVAYFARRFNLGRTRAAYLIGGLIFLVGIPASLSMGPWAEFTPFFGKGFFDAFDYLASNILLPLGGLLTTLFVGWAWGKHNALEAAGFSHDSIAGRVWLAVTKYVAPILIVLVLLYVTGFIKFGE